MNLHRPVSPPKLPPLFSPGPAGARQPDRFRRICCRVFAILAFLMIPAQAELPEPGRYVGTFGDAGRISYVINRSQTRIHSIKCSFIATNVVVPPGSSPEQFLMSFSSGKRDFRIYDSNSFRFSIHRNDPKTNTYYSFAIRQKRRGAHRGFIQAQQRIQVVNQTSPGQFETINSFREHQGAIYFETRLRR